MTQQAACLGHSLQWSEKQERAAGAHLITTMRCGNLAHIMEVTLRAGATTPASSEGGGCGPRSPAGPENCAIWSGRARCMPPKPGPNPPPNPGPPKPPNPSMPLATMKGGLPAPIGKFIPMLIMGPPIGPPMGFPCMPKGPIGGRGPPKRPGKPPPPLPRPGPPNAPVACTRHVKIADKCNSLRSTPLMKTHDPPSEATNSDH